MLSNLFHLRRLAVLVLVCGWIPSPVRAETEALPSSAELRWAIGPSSAVFQPNENVIATRVGGWFDLSYEDNDLKGRGSSLALNHANFFFDTRYRDQWQTFIEVEYEHETDRSGFEKEREFELEQAYARYNFNDWHHLRFGSFNTPFGYWTPLHWSILMDTIEKPLHEGNRLVSEQQLGVGYFGEKVLPPLYGFDTEFSYRVYVGYGDDPLGFGESKARGVTSGADIHVTVDDRHQLGISLYRQKNGEARDRIEKSVMLYGQASLPGNLLFRTEYLYQNRDRRTRVGINKDVDIFYAKLRWDFRDDAYLNYRFDYGDDDSTDRSINHMIHTFTVGIRPVSPVLVKLEYSSHELRHSSREDFNYWGLSFGYLF